MCLRRAVLTRVVFHAFRAEVSFGIESAYEAFFAFCRIVIGLGHEFLARSALCGWDALRILTRRACYLHAAVLTSVVIQAFGARVMLGTERAAAANFAFCLVCFGLGDEFLARSALCHCNATHTA